jgi:hypothetical protein
VFDYGSLRGLAFSMSQLLYGHPYCACPFSSGLDENIECIFVDISLPR